MKKLALCIVISLLYTGALHSQIFQQNFNSSSDLSDYIGSPPNSSQFDNVGSSNDANVIVSIVSNTLKFSKQGSPGTGSFSRITDFSPVPTGLIMKFDITISSNVSAPSVGVFRIGSGFSTSNSDESNTDTYARFTINFSTTDGNFEVKDITNNNTSSELSGTQTITWALNNTGSTTSYTAPDGSTESIGNDKADIWAGNSKLFDDVDVEKPTQTMTDVKFVYKPEDSESGDIEIDNLMIYGETNGALPVSLSSFNGSYSNGKVSLNWRTETEVNNYGFDIERAIAESGHAPAQDWKKVGFVKGNGNSNIPNEYYFVDKFSKPGIYNYRLKQKDFDGNYKYPEEIIVKIPLPGEVKLRQNYPNPFNPVTIISFSLPEARFVSLKVYDILGREVKSLLNGKKPAGNYEIKFDASGLNSGLYFYKIETGHYRGIRKMVLIK